MSFFWAVLLASFDSRADGGRPATDPMASLAAAARRGDLGELEGLAPRIPSGSLAACVASAARALRLTCIEVARFAPASPGLLGALALALGSRDRAVATAAAAAMAHGLSPERLARSDVTTEDLAPVIASLLRSIQDQRLGPDIRAAALHAMRPLMHLRGVDLSPPLGDPDPRVRREALASLVERGAQQGAVARVAETDPDDQIGALAAAALCESGRVSGAVDARVRRMLAKGLFGPATLGPLIACARARSDPQLEAWLAAARSSPREDIRALAGGH
ncbi:MAG: hypothetical protein HYY06_16865 [Deltaproteobacteria bacterium]|nr:hypothetical protein [Deltaproteobacteria bacterium]